MTTPEKKTPARKPKAVTKKTPTKSAPQKKVTAQNAVADTEKAVDHAVDVVKKKMSKHIDPTLREKANKIA